MRIKTETLDEKARKERDSDLGAYKEKWKDRYKGVSIYKETEDPGAFEKLQDEIDREHQEDQVPCIGELTLGSPEKALLKLPPGTSVNPKLSAKEFNHENEILNVKLRYEQRGWEEQDALYKEGLEACGWTDLEDEEKVRRAEEEACLRQIFDPINGRLDFTKKRVTDSNLNSHVHLPKELS